MTLSYDGTDFYGSQIQKDTKPTVLGELQRILALLHIQTKIIASGRTDRGVHASAQVCHFDLPPYWNDTRKLCKVLNEMVPQSIRIKRIEPANDSFHARYNAKKRIYRYIIKEGETNPFSSRYVTFLETLDFARIARNIHLFEGIHDFENFSKKGSDPSNCLRHIYKAFAYKYKDYIILHFEANGFLRAQIRLMVGALLDLDSQQIQQMLLKQKRYKVRPAPPNGLYLAKIKYEESIC